VLHITVELTRRPILVTAD
jgi:hypothetical protein